LTNDEGRILLVAGGTDDQLRIAKNDSESHWY
jgi:hypothetical protein